MSSIPQQLDSVSVKLKANVYFDGKVVSHTLVEGGGKRRTVGFIFPGVYKFNTEAAERMDIIAGSCRVKLAGETTWRPYEAGMSFQVGAKSFFEIGVDSGMTEYLCTFE